MNRLLLVACLWFLSYTTSGQITTHGFINYTTCPDYYSQVERCSGWRQPTGGTSDYFNACASGTDVGVPKNFFGYQTAVDNAYTGLVVHYSDSSDYKEYIGTSITPLIIGKTYEMSITVSLADISGYATDGLGVFFSTYPLQSPNTITTLLVTPQVDFSDYGIVANKTDWVTLAKTFVADSAYTDITVGCFKPVTTIRKEITTSESDNVYRTLSYYYISRIGLPDSTNEIFEDTVRTQDTVKYIFPNGFTPNGDGNNDVFRIVPNERYKISEYTLSVFNRWGQVVFFSHDYATGWDGLFNNIQQEIGAYYYMAKITADGLETIMKGDITLIK